MAFGSEIKRLREQEKLSVSKLATLLGVNASRLRKWEEKDFDPRYEDVQLIEKFFQIPIDDVKNITSLKPYLKVPYSYNSDSNEVEEPDYKDKYIKLLEQQNERNLSEIMDLLKASRDMLAALYDEFLPENKKPNTAGGDKSQASKKQ